MCDCDSLAAMTVVVTVDVTPVYQYVTVTVTVTVTQVYQDVTARLRL